MSAHELSVLFLFTLALPAQEAVTAEKSQRPAPVVVSTSFAGGTLAEFVAKIRAAEPKANIVVATAAVSAKLPPIELRGAGLEQALEGACAVAEAGFQVRVVEFKGSGEPVYSIIAVRQNQVGQVPTNAKEESTQVFSLNGLTDKDPFDTQTAPFRVETILSAIEAGTKDDSKPAVLRFHSDSGLLVVRGTRVQMQFAKEVLNSLERDLHDRRQRSQAAARKFAPKTDEAPATEPKKQ